MILTNSGVLKLMQRIKSFITSQLNTKAASVHTHSISEIDDLASQLGDGYSKSEVDTLLNGKSDTSHTHTKSEITDFPALSTVATSGDYDDLSNKPTIPTVNNATLTIQQNGTTVDTFTANSSTDKTVNIAIPTKTSDLTNDSGFITEDTTKIPLAGSNQISGSLIPATDRTVNLGSSSGRYNSVYTFQVASNNYARLEMCGGSSRDNGASLSVHGKDLLDSNYAGTFILRAADGSAFVDLLGKPDGTLTWNGQAIQTTSDQRLKQQITKIDDKLLDAWEDVDLVQFKYNDAVDTKKDKARLHTGYVVQQIDSACKSHGVDVSEYGLYCHEEYPQETEEVEVEQKDGTKVKETKVIREASEHYSLRYTEVYAVECMYLRRENARLKQQMLQYTESLSKFEERLKALEQTSK